MGTSQFEPKLSEKDFIHEGYSKNPWPLWLWLFLITTAVALLWGASNWYAGKINLIVQKSPFLQVTNRDLSLFLWQNPEFMRINAREKANYLTGFKYQDKITMDVANADQYAVAPPDVLFRYHTWNRLVGKEFTERPIPLKDFRDFLNYAEEWLPTYWPEATPGYVKLVQRLPASKVKDLSTLSQEELPLPVRMAFQGWQNYFKEGDAIDKVEATQKQMQTFLASHPHYARNYWQNIVADSVPDYLKTSFSKVKEEDSIVPSNELAPFLKVALYNFIQSTEHPAEE